MIFARALALIALLHTAFGTVLASHGLADGPAVDGGRQIVICTPQGLTVITLDESGKPVDDNAGDSEGDPASSAPHCPACLLADTSVSGGCSDPATRWPQRSLVVALPDDRVPDGVAQGDRPPPRAPPVI
ncbi:MAG: DUF2946 family protein [Alphaproteobacteria bacterium]|nr:DUF2946 family protein [Alphaproteobacteria bacterium]